MRSKKLIKSLLLAGGMVFTAVSQANLLLTVDLTVEDEITINATDGVSLDTFIYNDTLGVYLDGFFGIETEIAVIDTIVSGDLTIVGTISDSTPNLFRGGFSTDPGLNIFSVTDNGDITIDAGSQVFVGSATWSLNEAMYDLMISNAVSGSIYAPADTIDDISGASLIGTWEILDSSPPVDVAAPSIALLFGLSLLIGGVRRRA